MNNHKKFPRCSDARRAVLLHRASHFAYTQALFYEIFFREIRLFHPGYNTPMPVENMIVTQGLFKIALLDCQLLCHNEKTCILWCIC
jgi:hypothetical protein